MITRRKVLKGMAACGATAMLPGNLFFNRQVAAAPLFYTPFKDPLLVPPAYTPVRTSKYPGLDYYEIKMTQFGQQMHTDFPHPTQVWGYSSTLNNAIPHYPGFTLETRKNLPIVVKYINNLPLTHLLQGSIDPSIFGWMHDPVTGMEMQMTDYAAKLAANPSRVIPHLHGGFTAPQWDGHPESWFTPDGVQGMHYQTLGSPEKNAIIMKYSNAQPPCCLWYHDHGMTTTRLNVYAGLAGFYFVRDGYDIGPTSTEYTPLNLPRGKYEIPLALQDKSFNPDASLFYPTASGNATHPIWVPEFFGDTPVVNGVVAPYVNVEKRRYRLRLLNGCQARFLHIWFENTSMAGEPVKFWLIGTEGGLLPQAEREYSLLMAPAERMDVIIDFSNFNVGDKIRMKNDAPTPYPMGDPANPLIPEFMEFRVVAATSADTTALPYELSLPKFYGVVATYVGKPSWVAPIPTIKPMEIVLKETTDAGGTPIHVLLNQAFFMDPITEFVAVGSYGIWEFINLTVDAHPMHMHLVQFQALNRQPFDVAGYTAAYLPWAATYPRNPATKPVLADFLTQGPAYAPPAEEFGWKDTIKAYPGEITRVMMKFDIPPLTSLPAEYMYHCHIVEHEDNEMMRPFTVVPATPKEILAGNDAPQQMAVLEQNTPNPFNPTTEISFQMTSAGKVDLRVFNMIGQEVRKLTDSMYEPGRHSLIWNGKDNLGRTVSAGIYLYQLKAGGFVTTKRMVMLK